MRTIAMTAGWTYSQAGVNIDKKSSSIDALVGELKYQRKGFGQMLRKPCLFASLIDFGDKYVTLATDGVGTKIIIAQELSVWNTIGIDCIAMNVNDTICVNAAPISFVDYVAIEHPDETVTQQIGVGLNRGAEMSDMEIVGGEIAVLPEVINGIDLSGTCLGFVPKDKMIVGDDCRKGDAIVALKSSGIHSNGLTLARKVVAANNIKMTDHVAGLSQSIGKELLTPTEIYVKEVLDIAANHEVHGLVDITGGGLRNILRMRKGLKYTIDDPVKPAPIFKILQELGNIEDHEIYQTLNMSMGFTIIAPEEDAADIVREHVNAKIVGRVEEGAGVYFEPAKLLYDHY